MSAEDKLLESRYGSVTAEAIHEEIRKALESRVIYFKGFAKVQTFGPFQSSVDENDKPLAA
jgi:hypothetical protein